MDTPRLDAQVARTVVAISKPSRRMRATVRAFGASSSHAAEWPLAVATFGKGALHRAGRVKGNRKDRPRGAS